MTVNEDAEKRKVLVQLWQRVAKRTASDAERVHAAWLASQVGQEEDRPRLWALLKDSCPDVREYSLKAIGLQLDDVSTEFEERCWEFLIDDPSEDVRVRAAISLGRILWLRPSAVSFNRLVDQLKSPGETVFAKGAIYRSLFMIAHRPFNEWPGISVPGRSFRIDDLDWGQVAFLEDRVRELETASR